MHRIVLTALLVVLTSGCALLGPERPNTLVESRESISTFLQGFELSNHHLISSVVNDPIVFIRSEDDLDDVDILTKEEFSTFWREQFSAWKAEDFQAVLYSESPSDIKLVSVYTVSYTRSDNMTAHVVRWTFITNETGLIREFQIE